MTRNIDYSLHTHTIGFDGRNTVEQMIESAIARGFKTLGVSNHFIVHPNIRKSRMFDYAVRGGYENIYNDDLGVAVWRFAGHYDMVREIIREKYPNINLLCGMEMDWFKYDGWADAVNYAVNRLRPDYVIGAMHFIDRGADGVLNVHDMKNAPTGAREDLLREYYHNLIELAKFDWRGMDFRFNWIAHFDLPQKVGLSDEKLECAALDAFAENSVPLELNTALINNPRYQMKPSVIKKMSNIPVVLSDDAHDSARIGAGFDDMFKMMTNAGVKNICTSGNNLYRFVKIKSH